MFEDKRKRRFIIALAALSMILCTSLSVQAHFPWINLENGIISAGKNLKWTIGWGHRFPLAGFMKGTDMEEIVVIGPNGGSKTKADSISDLEFQSSVGLSQAGAYIVAGKRKTSFYTKTTEGGKRQSKKGLENVISCSRSHSFLKAIANVENTEGKVDTVVGHEIEIIPLTNPAALKVGDFLPIRIMLKGQPYSTDFFATYGGFSTENGVFAYSAKTDKNGLGKIKMLSSGAWLIKVNYNEPFADPQECDVESYLATLTFEVP
jgi:uncharacterized GH25 family protein